MTLGLGRLLTLSLLVVGLAGALCAPSASALGNEYVETPCVGNMYTDSWLNDDDWDDEWTVWQDCPNGYVLTSGNEPHDAGSSGEFSFMTTWGEIQRFTAHVIRNPDDEASNGAELTGIKVGVQACLETTCGPVVSSTGELDSTLTLDIEAGQVPAGAVTIRVVTSCELPTCPPYGSVVLAGVEITRRDDTPPLLDFYEMELDEFGWVIKRFPEATRWNNGAIMVSPEYVDLESQTLYFEAEIGGVDKCYSLFDPDFVVPDCTMWENQAWTVISATEMEDGLHDYTFSVTNRANLTTSKTIKVKTDATLPGQPYQFEISPQRNGWQNSRDVRVDWTNPGETVETATQSGIAGFTYDVDPKLGGANPPTISEDPAKKTVNESNADSLQLRFPGAGQWTVEIQTFDRAGNFSLAGTANVNIDDAREPAPEVEEIAPINLADRTNGRTISWDPGNTSVSGVCGYDWAFSATAAFNPGEDPATPLLADDAESLYVEPSQIQTLSERPQRFHLRGYSCAGLPGEITHEPVIVDFTQPTVVISPSSGSLAAGEPISIGAQDVNPGTIQSGVASVSCVINTQAVPCANGSQLQLSGGSNHVVVTAVDNAGNSKVASADLIADSAPPSGWFEPSDPADPTLVRASVQDADTGVKSAEIQYKPVGGGQWTRLGAGYNTGHPSTGTITLSGRIPDEGELSNGDYQLRAVAIDAAGADSSISQRAGGNSASFSIPLRATPVLSAGLVKSVKDKSDPLARVGVKYGAKPRLVGTLKRPDGTPIAGAQLTIAADQQGSPSRAIGTVTTAADGSYAYTAGAGGSRRFTVRYSGGLAVRSTVAEAQLRVSGKLSLNASRTSVRSKKALHLRGKVFSDGAALPLLGKAIELRFTIAGRRSGWVRTTRTNAAGRFDFTFRYKARSRPVRFVVRAVATAEPTWAFDEGISERVKFVVKP